FVSPDLAKACLAPERGEAEDLDRELRRVLDHDRIVLAAHGHAVLADVAEDLVMDAVAVARRRLERARIGGQREQHGEETGARRHGGPDGWRSKPVCPRVPGPHKPGGERRVIVILAPLCSRRACNQLPAASYHSSRSRSPVIRYLCASSVRPAIVMVSVPAGVTSTSCRRPRCTSNRSVRPITARFQWWLGTMVGGASIRPRRPLITVRSPSARARTS